MTPTIQDTLLELFDNVRQNPDTLPTVPVDSWQEGSVEWSLLSGFHGMLEQVQQRMHQFRQMEQQLREREEQYRSIFEAATDSLTISSLDDGQVVEANPATCKMLGYSYEELIGKLPWDLVPPDNLPLVVEGLQTLRAGGRNDLMMLTLRKDGTSFPTEVHSTLFNYKGKPHLLTVSRDITERVQAEELLREREEQYRSIFEATNDAVFIMDLDDGHIVEANPAACSMYGYSYEEFIGLPPSAVIHPDRLPGLIEISLPFIRAGGKRHVQGVNLRKDGSAFPIDLHQTAFTYQGKPHILSVMRDITEQVQAQEQLREKEEQYHAIFEATYDALFIMDLDGFLVEVNPAFCRMFGYPYEEIIGLHASNLTAPVSLPNLTEALKVLKAGKGTQTEMGQGLRKNGTTFYSESQSTTFTYRGKPHALGVVRDITERVEAELQLREREEQYRSVFEATSDGLIIRDMDGYVVEANPAAYSMHGYNYEEFIGLHRTDIIDPADHSMVAEYMKAIQAGRSFRGQAIDLRKDGTAFPVEVRGSTFTFHGKPHTLSVLRDITERVQAEQQLREKEEQYRSIFEASTDGLFIIDLEDSHVVEVNPMACQMWGYTHDEMLGRPIGISDDSQQIPVHALEVIQAGGQFQMRDITTRKDGTSFNVEVHATPFTYKGKPHLLAIVRDITEQVQAQQLLREQDEQYRSVFEATSDGLIIRNMEGTVVQVNPAACKMHGYGYEEYLALSRDTLIHPDYHPQLREIIQTVKAGRTFQGQAVDLRKDGSTFPVEFRSDPFTFLSQPHMLTVLHDITERAESERQLREREEQYRSIFEASADGLHIINLENSQVVEVNPAASKMYGYTREEMLGHSTTLVDYDETQEMTINAFEVIKAGGRFQTRDIARRKDGTVFDIDVRATPFIYKGKPHMLVIDRDITEQMHAEKLLEQRVEERTRELSSLLEISHTVASTLQLDPLLGLILDQLKTVVDYTGSAILVVEGEDLIVLDNRSPLQEVQHMQLRFPLKNLGRIW
ncbi:MAG TPA: PAS domain S-box protein, partial [Ktedonobacteraceae bacterium]|nr:PAS domain S-box protein [Ktedonobacteraceae bacterium]